MFNQFKLDPEAVKARADECIAALAAAYPGGDPTEFAADVLGGQLRAVPASYIAMGPYWWAVKAALRTHMVDFGPSDDPVIRGEYGAGLGAHQAMVAGVMFRDFYRQTYLAGTRLFTLDLDDSPYVLFDPDMEARTLGGGLNAAIVAQQVTES